MSKVVGVEKPGLSFAGLIFFLIRRKLGRVVRSQRIHALSPSNLRGYAMMEACQQSARSVHTRLKAFAQVRAAQRIGRPF